MKSIHIIFLLMLFACAQSSQIVAPSGGKGYAIDCNSAYMSMSSCYKKASEVCPYGYTVESKDKDEYIAYRSLVVSCKDKSAKQAQEATVIEKPATNSQEGCMNDDQCPQGKVCATVRGEYPGSCASK